MADPVTWRDVMLALSGAPIGALITVGGVALTNRHNQKTQQLVARAQADQHRAQLEADLRSSIQKQTLSTRSELYEGLLFECDSALQSATWGRDTDVIAERGPLSNEDLLPLWLGVKKIRFRALVHCSSPVRRQVERFAEAVNAVNETSDDEAWSRLVSETKSLQQAIIEAAVVDRSGGVAEDGLGGM